MGIETNIEWSDSTLNLQMGCDGCELWDGKSVRICYAGTLTQRYGGKKGWPESFHKPKLFPERLAQALRWPDLTGKERPDKPWLNGYPRTIFLDDLGDTFTESLPIDWLAPHVPAMEASPHIYILLTKRVKRMAQFFAMIGHVPKNFWLLTSVTSMATISRACDLLTIPGASVYGVSLEPLWGEVDLNARELLCETWRKAATFSRYLDWGIIGGQSGALAKPCDLAWVRSLIGQLREVGAAPFLKQIGSKPQETSAQGTPWWWTPRDRKGGDPAEWPADLRDARQMPALGMGARG